MQGKMKKKDDFRLAHPGMLRGVLSFSVELCFLPVLSNDEWINE